MINKNAVRTWVNALRSGKYEKNIGRSRSGDKYCAVGLGAHVLGFEVSQHDIFSNAAWALGSMTGIVASFSETPVPLTLMRIALLSDAGVSWDSIADDIEAAYLKEPEQFANSQTVTPELLTA